MSRAFQAEEAAHEDRVLVLPGGRADRAPDRFEVGDLVPLVLKPGGHGGADRRLAAGVSSHHIDATQVHPPHEMVILTSRAVTPSV